MANRASYSRWDGTQAGFELDADDVLAEITDDVLYHGDIHAALRRMLQDGLRGPNAVAGLRGPNAVAGLRGPNAVTGLRGPNAVTGLRELVERLRRRREEERGRFDLGGVYDDIARQLREVVDRERAALDDLDRRARDSGDARRREVAEKANAGRRLQLDLLPADLAGQVRELSAYDFVSAEARQRFDQLVERLRREVVSSQFNRMADALSEAGPEQMARMKDMLCALNAMLDARDGDEDPRFEDFMAEFGDFFPDNPRTLEELLEQMARQMAAMQALLASMTPEQRAQLQALSDQLLDDMDLRWQVDQLGRRLQGAFPDAGWGQSHQLAGDQIPGMAQAAGLMERLGALDRLEHLLGSAPSPGALAEVDITEVRDLLGDDAARSLERLAGLARTLEDAGLIETREGRLELTPRGLRAIGQNALRDLFGRLDKDRLGRHPAEREGPGHERSYETKAYQFGDPFNLNIERTVRNAVGRSGPTTPVVLEPDDFEVERTEALTRASTVLLVDLSLSMPMRDNFMAAKKVAMALHSLISTRYPGDYLGIVGFSEVARTLRPERLPEVSWDFVFGTNMQHALLLARQMLSRRPGTRQVLMITDGEPTAHLLPGGEPFFAYPPTAETVQATLGEVARCTAEGIRINTFMLDATPHLQAFVERMTRINHGRVFLTTPEDLGSYVLVDFMEQKRSRRDRRTSA